MTSRAQLKGKKLRKLDPRAHIGYLELIASIDQLEEEIAIPLKQLNNQAVLKADEPVFESGNLDQNQNDDEQVVPDDNQEEVQDDPADKRDYELAIALEEAFRTPPPTEPDQEQGAALSVFLSVVGAEGVRADITLIAIVESCRADFAPVPIETAYHGSFVAGMKFKPGKIHKRNLPDEPKTLKDLDSHLFKEQFRKAQEDHITSHQQMKSFVEVP
ncbi:hypothetical protein IWW34DRAFT_856251 [Fusarium oxysporum f. sp. albedinis]|nr:hypothetical protein IWW34DRAFT_856251 [Fusarium oxysporum f. sp. albedinis]